MPNFSWSLLEDRPFTASIQTNGTRSLVVFDSVLMEHEGALLCKVSCLAEKKQIFADVRVYGESRGKMFSKDYTEPWF